MKVGDVVELLSGGPEMVVVASREFGTGSLINVMWFAKNNGRAQFNTANDLPAAAFRIALDLSPEIKPTSRTMTDAEFKAYSTYASGK